MITLDTRISDALAERPELRELLPAFHPAFARLNHPVLGRVLPRMVTVRDAARIAGVDPDALLEVMSLPGMPHGAPPPAEAPRTEQPVPEWLERGGALELDVRPMFSQGQEPFPAVMGALRALRPGQPLTVLAPFEPSPLVRMLANRGWFTHVRWEGEVCLASFWRPAPEDEPAEDGAVRLDARLSRADGSWVLDVRDLDAPQPLHLAVAALDRGALPLVLVHRREPGLLYDRLRERGLSWSVSQEADTVRIRIDAP